MSYILPSSFRPTDRSSLNNNDFKESIPTQKMGNLYAQLQMPGGPDDEKSAPFCPFHPDFKNEFIKINDQLDAIMQSVLPNGGNPANRIRSINEINSTIDQIKNNPDYKDDDCGDMFKVIQDSINTLHSQSITRSLPLDQKGRGILGSKNTLESLKFTVNQNLNTLVNDLKKSSGNFIPVNLDKFNSTIKQIVKNYSSYLGALKPEDIKEFVTHKVKEMSSRLSRLSNVPSSMANALQKKLDDLQNFAQKNPTQTGLIATGFLAVAVAACFFPPAAAALAL